MMNSAPSAHSRQSATRTVVLGTIAIGTIDICWAIGNAALGGRGPIWLLQTIAGGVLGRSTYDGGVATAFLGMFLHYFIAFSVMLTYFLASRRIGVLVQKPWVFGPLYGVGVYLFMQLVVLPLVHWGGGLHPWVPLLKGLFIHIFGVGLIAALVTRNSAAR